MGVQISKQDTSLHVQRLMTCVTLVNTQTHTDSFWPVLYYELSAAELKMQKSDATKVVACTSCRCSVIEDPSIDRVQLADSHNIRSFRRSS